MAVGKAFAATLLVLAVVYVALYHAAPVTTQETTGVVPLGSEAASGGSGGANESGNAPTNATQPSGNSTQG